MRVQDRDPLGLAQAVELGARGRDDRVDVVHARPRGHTLGQAGRALERDRQALDHDPR